MFRKRVPFLVLVIVLLLMIAVPAAADTSALVRVRMVDDGAFFNRFRPKVVSITLGDSVGWKNVGLSRHTTTSFSGAWDSGDMPPGATFMFTPAATGTYDYYCAYHDGVGMVGRIIVNPALGTK